MSPILTFFFLSFWSIVELNSARQKCCRQSSVLIWVMWKWGGWWFKRITVAWGNISLSAILTNQNSALRTIYNRICVEEETDSAFIGLKSFLNHTDAVFVWVQDCCFALNYPYFKRYFIFSQEKQVKVMNHIYGVLFPFMELNCEILHNQMLHFIYNQ